MKKGICCAGNMIVDVTYPIETWPNQNELTHITNGIRTTSGGVVCNNLMDLSRLDPELNLTAAGIAGHDEYGEFLMKEMAAHPNIDLSMIQRDGDTSFTVVMLNNRTMERTFFQYPGASEIFSEEHIDWDRLDADILHIGYILLLPYLDSPDEQYGTKMARLLHKAQEKGLKTSIDIVSETGDRYKKIVIPALKYTDYCIINELEAQQTTGICLRDEDGSLHRENLVSALEELKKIGVSTWSVIHCPELGCGLDENGNYTEFKSLRLPDGYIKGTVGAGDAFCSGVLYGAEKGLPLSEAIKIGTCAAAAALSSPEASSGVGTVDEVLALYDLFGNE